MMYALVDNGQIVRTDDLDIETVPEHKRGWFLPIVEERPEAVAGLETLIGPETVIEATRVVRRWTVQRLPAAKQINAVKEECQRRIIALTGAADLTGCMIKQSNSNMRANELNDLRLRGQILTAAEDSEASALRALADAIKSVRAKSNAIEAMTEIPLDFRADPYWGG